MSTNTPDFYKKLSSRNGSAFSSGYQPTSGAAIDTRKLLVAVNDHGNTIGEDHSRATLTDAEVRLMRELRDTDPVYWSYRKLADAFEVSKKHAWRICQRHQRAQIVDRWVRR